MSDGAINSAAIRRGMWALSQFFFSRRRRDTRFKCDWSSDVCSSDLSQYSCSPAEPGEQEYWLKSNYNGRQKWHRVGRYDGVKKAKLLLEREQERNEAARKYGLVAPASVGHVTVAEGVEKFIQRKIAAGKRPGSIASARFTLGLFQEFCPCLYIDQVDGDTLLDFAAWCRKRGDGDRTVANRFVSIAIFMKFHGKPKLVAKSDWPKYTERRRQSYRDP